MTSPFPGMDPYLEHPEIWPGFHHRLANEVADQLNPLIEPKYYADIEVRTVVEEVALGKRALVIPDTAIFDRSLTAPPAALAGAAVAIPAAPIRRTVRIPTETKLLAVQIFSTEFGELVTSIELLSPYNKRQFAGLNRYQHKRRKLLRAPVHLVEIDLLRDGVRPGPEVQEPALDTDYVLLVNRNQDGADRASEIWPVALNEALPIIPIPLLPPDPDAPLDLRAAITNIYARARYRLRIDYRQPVPPPTLRPAMATWLAQALPEVASLQV
ncbi:MAG: DUF4058 family protein [Caldilineaceae bacterium]